MIPRSLLKPRIVTPRDPGTVAYQTPVDEPNTYFETVLPPDEAALFGARLIVDAHRAKQAAEAAARRKERP